MPNDFEAAVYIPARGWKRVTLQNGCGIGRGSQAKYCPLFRIARDETGTRLQPSLRLHYLQGDQVLALALCLRDIPAFSVL